MEQNPSGCFIGIWNYHLAPLKSKSRIFPGPYQSPLCVPSQTCYRASYLVTFFDYVPFQSSNFLVKLIIQISPTVVGFNEAIRTQNSKTINNMGANGWINVLRLVFSNAWPVPSPVGVIAYNLYQNKNNIWKIKHN